MTTRPGPSGKGLNAVVIGASGGIGRALVDALGADPSVGRVYACSRCAGSPPRDGIEMLSVDVTREESVAAAARGIGAAIDLVIVATGVLHDDDGLAPEKRWEDLDAAKLARAFAVNTIGPAIVAKHFAPLLRRDRRSVFAALSARVGSIGDNRLGGWYAYRASKAALNMLIRTLAIELGRRNPQAICVALHPGTVETPLSAPYRSRLPGARIIAPAQAAANLLAVIAGLDAGDSGRLIAWNGETLTY